MGKMLDAILGKSMKQTSKLKSLLSLCVDRIAVLRTQHQAKCSQARGDVVQLLQLGDRDRALARAEQVTKEQNLLDVFVMIEGYCHLLTERVVLLDHQIECPDELREAISSLIFAASRSGELPELQDIRRKFTEMFGREFASAAVNLSSDCRVNPKMIRKMSTRQPNLESKSRVIWEIAQEQGIDLNLDGHPFEIKAVDSNIHQRKNRDLPADYSNSPSIRNNLELYSESMTSMTSRESYKEVGSIIQAPFQSEAYEATTDDFNGENSPGSGWRDKSPDRSINKDQKIVKGHDTEWLHSDHKNSPLPPRYSSKFNSVIPRREFVPSVDKSSSSLSSASAESLFEIKREKSSSSLSSASTESLFETIREKSSSSLSSASTVSLFEMKREKSLSSLSSASTESHSEIKRTVLYEPRTRKLSATHIAFDVSETEKEKSYDVHLETVKQYGIGGMSLPTRKLTRFSGISRNSFQLHSQLNEGPSQDFHNKPEVTKHPLPNLNRKPKEGRRNCSSSLHDEIELESVTFNNTLRDSPEERCHSDMSYHDSPSLPPQQSKKLNNPMSVRTWRRFQPDNEQSRTLGEELGFS